MKQGDPCTAGPPGTASSPARRTVSSTGVISIHLTLNLCESPSAFTLERCAGRTLKKKSCKQHLWGGGGAVYTPLLHHPCPLECMGSALRRSGSFAALLDTRPSSKSLLLTVCADVLTPAYCHS
ncbi:hypothetical protein AB205_0193590 [Aquarana catesbeiana]|uniref:Uncharacterized protein n=1 Tax=Aquarana catesbeiana TaxID=8400 RepID=A0A2G9RWJ8_AQUCT|nr:hypothetical protein AB205_0193590 [Aquarana catesbeiana]